MNADDMFAAAREIGMAIAAQRQAARVAQREARNARRRAAYARKPKPVRVKPEVVNDDEFEMPTECYCPSINYPPCGWCEHGGDESTEGVN